MENKYASILFLNNGKTTQCPIKMDIERFNPKRIVESFNTILRGWINDFDIPKGCYLTMSNKKVKFA